MIPSNDISPAPFGALAPNAAQAAIIRLAHRTGLRRGAFRPWLSRLVNLLGAGPLDVTYQGASFRFHHQHSATERGALFNPDYNLEDSRSCAAMSAPAAPSSISAPMSAPMRWRWRAMSDPMAR